MPITDDSHRIPINLIHIDRASRQRREIETADLEKSIARIGLLQPILVKTDIDNINNIDPSSLHFTLVAGERRLQACKNLGHDSIPVRFVHKLSPIESSIIELEENIKRSDLTMPDLVGAVARIHSLYQSINPDWTLTQTAESISLSPSTISMYLSVAKEISIGNERVQQAGTIREAYNTIKRRNDRQMAGIINDLLAEESIEEDSPEESILNADFLEWAPNYTGPKFNLIHCDFPFGINIAAGPQDQLDWIGTFGSQARGAEPNNSYPDSEDLYFRLVETLCTNLCRIASNSTHLLFWYSDRHKEKTLQIFQSLAPFIHWQTFPLIWLKSNNHGISPEPNRTPRHIYETCLLGTIGDRYIVKIMSDAYACPTNNELHPNAKPESMLRHFLSMFVDDFTTFFDPTCGSGSSIRAAESLGAKSTLGLEINPNYYETAKKALKDFRTLRSLGV